MKTFFSEFLRRGVVSCGLGPIVLALLYLILQRSDNLDTLTVTQVCNGIFSLTILAFVAGGMNAIYQVEQIPLMTAILIHGSVLYIGYLATYLVNNWLKWDKFPILVFSGIFVIGYFAIWIVIYLMVRKNTKSVNEKLRSKQNHTGL